MKSEKTLKSFVAYCEAHPDQRFWQALKNWSGYYAIFGLKDIQYQDRITIIGENEPTFFKE